MGRSLFRTQQTYVCHRSGCKRIDKPKPKVEPRVGPVARPEDEDVPLIGGIPLPKETKKQQSLALQPVLENEGGENEGGENKGAEQHSSDDESKDSGRRKKRNAKGSMKVGMARLLVYEPKDMK
ncbi:hypothetical protein BGX26_008938, partial [Mortierella sp. AD094]